MEEVIRSTAAKLDLLSPQGDLKPLESLDMVSFVVALEQASGKKIPSATLFIENFVSVASVAALLSELD